MTLMNSSQHQQASDLEWDPSGRYVVTSVSVWKQKVNCTHTHNVYTPYWHLDVFCYYSVAFVVAV